MDRTKKTGSVRVLIILSILLALSGMAAIASEDDKPITNIFYGNVTLNGADASPGTVINAYIDGKPSGSFEIKDVGMYYISVEGNESDAGGIVTSKVCGATADQTAVWHASYLSTSLDLSACDNEPPAVTNPDANPSSIVADGVQESQLNVTVIDGCKVHTVTVNLSAIGGSDAQEMDPIGDDVYSTTVSAVEGTKMGTYCLRINASDMHRNWNDSVCIVLEVTAAGLPKTGDIVINEIMYDPDGDEKWYEWIELYNNDTEEINVDGWILNGTIGGSNTILSGTMSAGTYLLIAKNVTAFHDRYPDATCPIIEGNWSALANPGDTIDLWDSTPLPIDTVTYTDIASENHTAERNAAGGWEGSLVDGGTPCAENSVFGDTTPPVITDVACDTPTTDSVTITWTTDEDSNSLVKYGNKTGVYTGNVSNTTMVTSHSITLTGLTPETTYYFVVNSTDASDNPAESAEYSFRTASVESIAIKAENGGDLPAIIPVGETFTVLITEGDSHVGAGTNVVFTLPASGGTPIYVWTDEAGKARYKPLTTGILSIKVLDGLVTVAESTVAVEPEEEDTTPPIITANTPTGTDVPVSAAITVIFDEAMNQTSAEAAFSVDPSVTGSFIWDGNTMTFTPEGNLAYSTTYNMTIGTIAEDLAGNPLADDFTWGFTTKSAPASPSPSITNWSNDKTNDNALTITVNESEAVCFSATADQTIDTWDWYKDGADQSHNFDNYTTSWSRNGTYSVSVNATNANGTSNMIAWTITVNDITPPAQVTGLTNDTPTTATVNLSWNANVEGDLAGYRVYQDGSLLGSTANTYYNVAGLAASTTYEFNVSAYDDNGLEGENDSVTVTTAEPAPSIVSSTPFSSSPVDDIAGAIRTFSIEINQTVDVIWYINGSEVQTNSSVTPATASYTNTSAEVGCWNVSAVVSNVNGDAMQEWTWIVTPGDVSRIDVESPDPLPTNIGMNGTFTATCYNANDYLIDATVAWGSSNPYVGTIDETGYFEALHAGPTNITAESGGVPSNAVTLTVDGPVNNSTTTADIESTVTSDDVTITGNFSVDGWVNVTAIGDPEDGTNTIGSGVIQIKGVIINVSDSILAEMEAGNGTLTLTICYNATTDTTLEGIDLGTIAIWKFNETSGWEKLGGTISDNCVSVTLDHLGTFALVGSRLAGVGTPGDSTTSSSSGGGGSGGTYPPGWGETPTPTANSASAAAPEPTVAPAEAPTVAPTKAPTKAPTAAPTEIETTKVETKGTPGFGAALAVFAIAGLLVATYLVMRRRE